jgi:ubiquinone/menaquinone biosynthesis C-methylase UbiE
LGDARTLPLPESAYDLVCTHFFLDCLDEKDADTLVGRISRACAPRARWMISEFREPGFWARAVVRALYFFFRVTTGLRTTRLIDHRPLLLREGFRLERVESARFGLLVSELWIR